MLIDRDGDVIDLGHVVYLLSQELAERKGGEKPTLEEITEVARKAKELYADQEKFAAWEAERFAAVPADVAT